MYRGIYILRYRKEKNSLYSYIIFKTTVVLSIYNNHCVIHNNRIVLKYLILADLY